MQKSKLCLAWPSQPAPNGLYSGGKWGGAHHLSDLWQMEYVLSSIFVMQK